MASKHKADWHGMSKTPMYKLWLNIKDRCLNPKNPYFHNYGGRGIKICKAWAESFMEFQEAMGPRPTPAHTLDRMNNDGDYEPGNMAWATKKQQANNTRKNVNLTFNSRTQTLAQWAAEIGVVPSTLHYRINQGGMTVEAALTTPYRRGRRKQEATA